MYATEGIGAVVVPCVVLWASLYAFGALGETRSYSRTFEWLRLLVVVPAGFYVIVQQGSMTAETAVIALLVYCGRVAGSFCTYQETYRINRLKNIYLLYFS